MPDRHILIETASKTTTQNLRNAKELMEQYNLDTAVIISDP
ncbi:MAG: YdcF family protein, partial [Bacteroidota bacterium]